MTRLLIIALYEDHKDHDLTFDDDAKTCYCKDCQFWIIDAYEED